MGKEIKASIFGKKVMRALSVLLAVVLVSVIVTGVIQVKAFPEYEFDEDNNMTLVIRQKMASSSSTFRYVTVDWYLHPEKLYGDMEWLSGFGPDALPVNIKDRDREVEGDYYIDTITLDSENLIEWAIKHFSRDDLIKGKTVYASRSLKTVDNKVSPVIEKGPFYCYEDIVAQANWSKGALRTFSGQTYDQEVYLKLKSTQVTVQFMDYGTRKPLSNDVYSNPFSTAVYLYGETLDYTAPDINDYTFEYYEISGSVGTFTGQGGNKKVDKVLMSSELGEDITVYFYYKEKPIPTAPPQPDDTQPSPGATIAPVSPTPTITPTTAPSPTPTTYVTLKEKESGVEYYFTTDKGYTLNALANSTSYSLAGYMTNYQTGKIGEFTYLKRDASYTVGEDDAGNTWYFIPNGIAATWVHPAVYKGYNADTTDVQYITELTFPSYIIYNGTSYKVVSIGGGSSVYRTPGNRVTISENTRTEEGEYYHNEDYSYGWYDELVIYSSIYRFRSIGYEYGILGNGAITSAGSQNRDYISSSSPELNYNYWADYYVYNTTLREITIPDTVTSICDNAFLYCEALSVINGGANVTGIGKKSFMAANVKTAAISFAYNTSTSTGTCEVDKNYYYNTSTSKISKTSVMTAWENSVRFKEYMPISNFKKLKTLGTYSFAYHTNIGTVILSDTVTNIGADAFLGCKLDSISIPNSATVVGTSPSAQYNTLGTKGRIRKDERTIIYTKPDAKAFTYGRNHKFYYNLMAGHPVNYHPNGGTPNEVVSYNSVMEDIKLPGGEWLTGNYFVHGGKLYFISTNSSGTATITERGVFTMPGTVKEWISRDNMNSYSGFLYETDSGELGIWFAGRDSKIPLPLGSTFLGYQYKYNNSAYYYMYVYYTTSDNRIYSTHLNYSSDSNTWSSASQIFTSAYANGEYTYAIPYEADGSGHRFALVRENREYTSHYDYYYIFSMENLPTQKIDGDSDAGTEDNYVYKSVSLGTALPTGMKKQLAQCFYISNDNRLYFKGRYEEEAKYITLPHSIAGETYVLDAYYDSLQYAYVKFIDSAGRVFYVRCSDARSTASRYFVPIIKYCAQLSSGVAARVYAGGVYFYVDRNGYYYYVTDTTLENNPVFTNLLKEDGSKFRGQEACGELLKASTFLVDLNGYFYTAASSYDANNKRANTAKAFMINGTHFRGLDGEVTESVILETGYLHGYTSNSSYYYGYYLTDQGSLYMARGSSGATTYLNLEKLTPDGVRLTEIMWDRNESYRYLNLFAFDSEGGLWSLGRNLFGELGHGVIDVDSGENTQTSLKTLYQVDNGIRIKEIYRFDSGTYVLDENNNLYRSGRFYENKNYSDITEFTLFDVLDGKNASVVYDVKTVGDELYFLTDYGCIRVYDDNYWVPAEYVADLSYEFIADIYSNEFFNRNGYKFTGWNAAANGAGEDYLPGNRLVVTDEINLYAQWEAKLPTIHYDANGGRGGMADTVFPRGTTSGYLEENRFYRTDYKFTSWNTMPDGSGVSYADKAYITGITGEITLYAQWEEVVVNYTIVYMKYPYGTVGNMAWKTKNMVSSVSNTTRETIEGQPMTPTGYTVSYDLNRTGSMSTVPVMGTLTSINTTTAAPTFECWQLREPDADGVHRYYGDNYAPGDVVSRLTTKDGTTLYLYPTWGGSGAYVILPDATCEGYTLVGWCEFADGSSEIYYPNDEDSDEVSTYVPLKDTTLFAIWEADSNSRYGDFYITGTKDKEAVKLLKQGIQALILKPGYQFLYKFCTGGSVFENLKSIQISPKYIWISKDETERKEVQVYYHALIDGKWEYFLAAGSEPDKRNGQDNGIVMLCEYRPEENNKSWDGEFSLPAELFVVWEENVREYEEYRKKYALTGKEAFFVRRGYISVAFQAELCMESGETLVFDFWEQTKGYQDAMAAGWNWLPGDVVRYDLESSSADDYTVGGVE